MRKKFLLMIFVLSLFTSMGGGWLHAQTKNGVLSTNAETITLFKDDFNDGNLDGWGLIDGDNDGNNWYFLDNGNGEGNGCIISKSYLNKKVLRPKNYIYAKDSYLISESSVLTWDACPSHSNYVFDSYSVVISTNKTDWVKVFTENFNEYSPTSFITHSLKFADDDEAAEYVGKKVYFGFLCDGFHEDGNCDGVKIDNIKLTGAAPAAEPVAKIGETPYTSFADALNAAESMTGDVTVEIYEKVTMNQALAGSYNSIKFVGKDTDAEIYLDVQGYTTATGKKVSFTDLKLSKSVGGFITNAGFMNVAFGIFDVAEVSYTNCTFLNGAYASSGKVTFNGCTFYRSHDKYGLWAYGNVDITVDGSTFADYRGIKMYAENGANASVKKPKLVVNNTNFSAVNNKPAIVLTYGESVQLAGNTYSTTGVFELDIDGKPNGVAVTSDVAPTCINDNGACGVLVDGKIYTTVAQAAEVATSGSTVTLLHNSTETVKFPMGVTLEKNGFEANGVTVVVPVAQIGEVKYETFQAALKAIGSGDVVINLLKDVTMDITAWQTLAIGAENTTSITIDGENGDNDFTLTFNKLNSDWNHIATSNDNATKLILKNLKLADSGKNNGPWNRYDHNFACDVELTNVVSNKALAFKAGATLYNVTINETGDNYAIWIQPNGQDVNINGLTVVSAGRGIKIDNQYVGDAQLVNLSVKNAQFETVKKAAIVVKSPAGANIVAENVDITKVAADSRNLVWVDEDGATDFGKVTLTGGTVAQEGLEGFVAAISANDKVQAYYTSLQAAIDAVQNGETIVLTKDCAEVVSINKSNVAFTINGKISDTENIAYTGKIQINVGQNVTVKNINFSHAGDEAHDFIANVGSPTGKNYNTTLLVEGCSFVGGNNNYNTVAVRTIHPTHTQIKNSTGTGLHSFLQNTGGQQVTVEGVVLTDSKGGLAIGSPNDAVSVKGCDLTTNTYGVRLDANNTNAPGTTLENNKVNAYIPVSVRKATAPNYNLTFNGEENAYVATNGDNVWCAVCKTEYEEGVALNAPTSKVRVTLNDTELSYEGVYGNYYELAGEGTAENPYLINSVYDLKYFRDKVDEQAQDGSTQFAGKYFKLTANLDLAGINWNPIGSMSGDHGSFKGVFDGGDHTISNLNCEQAGNGLGLFARTAGNAEIKNLKLNNVTVKSTDNSNYVGGVVGNAYASTKINNVHVSGTINIAGRGYIGGIAGHGYVVMDNVSVVGEGTISSTFWCAGGVLGYAGEGTTNIKNAHVEGITITSAAGGLGAIVGMAEDNEGTQPISGSNLSAKNVEIKTYVGAYGTNYEDYAIGYLYGGNPTSKLTGELNVENVTLTNASGKTPAEVSDAVANVDGKIYFAFSNNEFKLLENGNNVTILRAGKYSIPTGKDLTITGVVNGVVFENIGAYGMGGANVTFNNVTFNYAENSTYKGLQHSGSLVYNNCTFNGQVFLYGASETFNNCKFSNTGDNYNVWTYGAKEVAFNGCTFNCDGKSVLIYTEGKDTFNNVTVTECIFNASKAVEGKAAIEMDSSLSKGINLTIDGETTATGFGTGNVSGNSLWNNKKANNDITVVVNNETVLAPINGDGTEDNPYLINNVRELVAFRESVNAGKTEFNAPGVYVALGADIDLAGINWVGIGSATKDHGFMGNFDGQGYKIKNLKIENPTVDADGYAYAGLFSITEGVDKDNQNTIKNLTIENVTIKTTGNIAAAAIAYPYYTIIDNVKVCGNIAIEGGAYTAGALAYTRRCVNASNITVVGNEGSYVKGDQVVGGVISDIQMNGGLTAVYSNFSAEGLTVEGTKNVGGISGIIATQTLDGATVKNVALVSEKASVGSVAGALGGTSTISNVTIENVTGATSILGTTYDGKAIEAKIGDTYYATLANALAANGEATVKLLTPVTIPAGETVVYNLNGKTVVATDNATGSYAMITNKGDLTIEGEGALELAATNNRGWNAYSSVISNTVGGKLTVNGGTIEHLGGTDMAYGIDNLTNGKGTYAETIINGGTVKSTYRAVRQFLNGVEAQNILTVNGGTIEGANKSIWMQDPSKNANTGSLTVGENANLVGNVYLFVTAGSTEWPVSVNIAAAALADGSEVMTGNVPSGYEVALVGGNYGVFSGVAKIGTTYYATFQEALEAIGEGDVVIKLLNNVTMDITAWQTLAIGAENTTSITIDGENGDEDFTLTFNKLNSDWNHVATSNDNATKLILKNLQLADSGKNNGPWNRYDHNFACDVELKNVVSNKAIAFKAGATLNNVTINEEGDNYAIWIQPNGQNISINGLTVNSAGRGIKIDNQYVDKAQLVNITLKDATFTTVKKAAIMVKTPAGANITAENVDITKVDADPVNLVWVDEDGAANFGEVTVTGGTVAQESIEEFFAANTKDAKVEGYYKTLQAAVNAAQDGETVSLLKDIAENVTVSQNNGINIVIDGQNHNFSGTITIDGNSRTTGESLTIQNVNFVTNVASLYFIDANSTDGADRYPHNVTVKDCTFTAEENSAAVNTAVAMRLRQGFNITVENVTAVRLHSLMQNYGVAGVTVNKVKVDGKNGIAFGTSTNVTVTDATIKAVGVGYGLRVDASVTTPITIADSEIEAFIPVVVRYASADANLTFNGTNDMTATNTDGYWCVIGTSEYEANGELPTAATGNVFVSLNDEGLSYEGIYGHYAVAQIGDVKYATLQAAIDAVQEGETITVVREIALTEGLTVAAGKVVTLDLNGKTVTGTPEVAAAFAVITNMGDLTITNGTIICDHKLAGSTSYAVNTIVNSGKLTIDGATVENKSEASNQIGYAIDNNSTSYNSIVVIKAGKVTASGSNYYDGIRMFCNNTTAENNVIIEGGEVSSLWMQNPSDGAAGRNTKDVKGSFEIKGGSLNALYLEPSAAFAGSISAGYVGSVSAFETADGRDLIAFITGGTFGKDVTAFLAPGYSCEQNADGIYTVKFAYVEIDYTTYSLIFSITDFDAKEASVKIGSKAPSSGVKLVTPTEVQINGETYSVTSLAKNAFSGTNFASIEISEGVTTIGDYALANMYKLTDVIFPSTLKTVGNRCFYGYGPTANSLKTITSYATEVPAAEAASFQTAVGQNATLYVYGNYNDYKKAEGWKKFTNIIGKVIVEKEGYSLLVKVSDNNCSVQINDRPAQAAKLQLEIPAEIDYFGTTREITSIANNGFKSCSFYGTITVPGTIKTVGNSAFNTCTQVSKVVFEEGVETIGTRALATMGNLTTVVFPSTLKTLADECFYGYHAENHKVTTIVSYATEAPTAVAGTFQQGICNKATLYVFEDAIASYKAAAGWKKFVNVKAIEAQIGETYYLTLASAIKAAQAGDVIELIANVEAADATPIVIPTDVTLNINTHNIKANIYGTVKTEGGVWTTVAVPGFASRAMFGEGAIYSTTDATVANLENEIEVVAGTIVLNPNPEKEWWTLPGQSLSIAEDATFKVPANVKFTVRENTHVVAAGTIVTEGVVYLQAGATVRAEAGLNIQTTVAGHVVDYNNGVYSVVEQTIFTQTIQLNAGWNWFSSYVETDLESLQAALGTNGVQIKSDNDGYDLYYAGYGWGGSLNTIESSQMYMIQTSAAHELVLSGELLENVEITLNPGWNWISFPMNANISVADAFAGLSPNTNDQIKSDAEGYALYYAGYGWGGSLNTLKPGQGYMYYSSSETPVTFTYSPSISKSEAKANVTTDGNYWTPNAAQFANNMTMTAVLDVENINYEVAAFVNGECRGSARPIYVEALDAYMLFLTIHGEEVEEMTFKYYDIDTDIEYTLSDRINYSNNAILGSLKEPYMFTRGTTGIGEAELSQLNIYPNPTTTAAEINLNATFDKVEVFNALGVKVAEYSNVDSIDALETAGIYVIRATNNSVISHCRLVVK